MKHGAEPWRVLTSTRWLFGHLLALVLIALFVVCGFWQLDRLQQKRTENLLHTERQELPPLQLDGTGPDSAQLADPDAGARLDLRNAVATGRYLVQDELLLRSRSWNGQPGWHVLTPLELQDGALLLVDRGWVPYEFDQVPVEVAAPPEGTVTVTGVLRASQTPPTGAGASIAPRDPPEGVLRAAWYVDLPRLQGQQLPELLPGAWLLLREQQPAQSVELPYTAPAEPLDEGPHLGYAIQWFAFAAVGIIGYFFLMRKVLHEAAAGQGSGAQAG